MGSTDRPPTIPAVMPSIKHPKRHKTHFATPLQLPARGATGETGGADEAEGGLVRTFNVDVAFVAVGVVDLVLGGGVVGGGVLLLLDDNHFLSR